MNERDELWNIVAEAYGDDFRAGATRRAANAILAAGYRKPRTIETAGGLRELPALAVVLFDDTENGGPFQTYVVPDDGTVMFAHRTGEFHFNDFGENYIDAMDMPLPVTVLWEPR